MTDNDQTKQLARDIFPEATLRAERDEQTRRADRWMMRYHVAAKQLRDWVEGSQAEHMGPLQERTRTLLAAVEQGDDEAKALVDELHRLRRLRKALFDNNRWQARKLDKVYQLAHKWAEDDEPGNQVQGNAILDLLNETEDQPFYGDDILTCAFTWDDDDKIIPETGYGNLRDTGEKLVLTFDCGQLMATADVSYDYLGQVLAKSDAQKLTAAVALAVVKKDRDEWEDRAQRLAAVIEQGTHMKLGDGLKAIAEWEQEHGALTDQELAHATRLVKAREHWHNFTTVEDKRVLEAIEGIPTRVLQQAATKFPALETFVKFELASRIAAAIVDVPWYWDAGRIQETSVLDLRLLLDRAERYGAELGAMTDEQRKEHYQAWLEGRVDDVTMQIRAVPSDSASEPKPG